MYLLSWKNISCECTLYTKQYVSIVDWKRTAEIIVQSIVD